MESINWSQLNYSVGRVFTPGAPISEAELFSGRIDQISKIIETISSPGYHAILYGERGVGKTSLSNVLLSFLNDIGGDFLLPRVNCDKSDTFTTLWKKQFDNLTITKSQSSPGFVSEKKRRYSQTIRSTSRKTIPRRHP